jgi:hypothetical protein
MLFGSDTSIAASAVRRRRRRWRRIPSTISRGGRTEHGALDDRTRCFDGQFDGRGDARAPGRRRMSRALPSSKITSWPRGDPPADVTTRVRAHCIHFYSRHVSLAPSLRLLCLPAILVSSLTLHPLLCLSINFDFVRIHPFRPLSPLQSYLTY